MVTLNARLVTATPEDLIGYCARVSNPANQDNPNYEGLLRYCIKNKHWSVFEMATAIVEVEAPRDISRQLLRHRSFSFQEFSQRYSDAITFTKREFRAQDTKNRQNSIDSLDEDLQENLLDGVADAETIAADFYFWAVGKGVAKECARVVLPEGLTMSKLYVSGTLRSWIHYLDVRDDPGVTQHEHVLLARKIREALMPAFPITLNAISEEPRLL
jgi:thymidylate synthase (FAD)